MTSRHACVVIHKAIQVGQKGIKQFACIQLGQERSKRFWCASSDIVAAIVGKRVGIQCVIID